MMSNLDFDISHLLAGSLVLVSLLMIYQSRMSALLNIFAVHACILAVAVSWQAHVQEAPRLFVTALIALCLNAIAIPLLLRHVVRSLDIHREIEKVVGTGFAMITGLFLTALSIALMLRIAPKADLVAREDLAFSLAVVLIGLLIMITRRNALSQVVGFMSLENGLVLAATGAKGMPFVVEISIAVSVLVALIVIGIFLFRIRERFDTIDLHALDRFRRSVE